VYTLGWRDLHDIEAEIELLHHLHAHDLPVSYPIATRAGAYILSLHAREGTRYAVLFSAAEGRLRDEQDHRSYMYGRLIGQVHVCADRMPAISKRLHMDHDHLLHSPLRCLEPFLVNVGGRIPTSPV
jgi:Ser/Thr protein kinase RdoA (MazF antagonist)